MGVHLMACLSWSASHGRASHGVPRIGVHLRDVPLTGVPLMVYFS